MKASKSLFNQTLQTLGWLLIIVTFGLFLDSKFITENFFEHSQWINNILVFLVFLYFFKKGTSRMNV